MTPDDPRPPEPDPQVPDESGAAREAPDGLSEAAATPTDPTAEAGADAPTSGPASPVDPTTGTTPAVPREHPPPCSAGSSSTWKPTTPRVPPANARC